MPDERGQFAGPDGSIAVLGEIRKRRIEHFGCGFVKMKDRQQRANAAAEDERGIVSGKKIERAAHGTAALGERHAQLRERHPAFRLARA